MFEGDGFSRRPAYLPVTPAHERPDKLERGRPRQAVHFDEPPHRQILESAAREEEDGGTRR